MSGTLRGPMFEPAEWGVWKSIHKQAGGHYNTFACKDHDGMTGLREFFPKGEADKFNQCLFSTSGIHGMYTTIEEVEAREVDEDTGETIFLCVTFCIVQPRICTIRYGNCIPQTPEDFAFLKKLRQSSWDEFVKIGRHTPNPQGKPE
jgi:hypothetical protein